MLGEHLRHRLLLVASLLAATAGVVVCAFGPWPDQGGRGGAISVAISLFSLFANKPHGSQLFKMLTIDRDSFFRSIGIDAIINKRSETDTEKLHRLTEAMEIRINVDEAGQNQLNKYMTFSAVYGTIVWGFGDWFSWWIIDIFHLARPTS